LGKRKNEDETAVGQVEEEIVVETGNDDDSSNAKMEEEGGLSEGAMYGLIGGLVGLCIIVMIGIALWIWRKRTNGRTQKAVESAESESMLTTLDERRKSVGTLPSTHAGSDPDSRRNMYATAPTSKTLGSDGYSVMPSDGYSVMPSDGYAAMPSEPKSGVKVESGYSAMPKQDTKEVNQYQSGELLLEEGTKFESQELRKQTNGSWDDGYVSIELEKTSMGESTKGKLSPGLPRDPGEGKSAEIREGRKSMKNELDKKMGGRDYEKRE